MRIPLLVAGLLALAVPTDAQTRTIDLGLSQAFSAPVSVSILPVTGGELYEIRLVEGDPTVPGREIAVFLPVTSRITVGRWHPSKHGVGGIHPGAGLCVEAWTALNLPPDVWNYHMHTPGDLTGDGIDDWVAYREDGTVSVYAGRGLTACR